MENLNKLTIGEVERLLPIYIKDKRPVLLVGAPGIGKSDIITQAASKTDHVLHVYHPVLDDPTDYKGLPFAKNGHADFLPYGNLLQLMTAKEPTIAFLDDLGQAPESVQAALMQLLLAREINGNEISEHVTFIAATNRRKDRAGVRGILEPVKSRFNAIFELMVSHDDWYKWALNNKIPEEIVAFLRFRPELLTSDELTADMNNNPSPRTWAKLGEVYRNIPEDLLIHAAAGSVGDGAATEFNAFIQTWGSMPDPDDIIANPDKFDAPKEMSVQFAIVTALSYRTSDVTFDNIMKYLSKFTPEFQVLYVKDAITIHPGVCQLKSYIRWATNEGAELLGTKR